jgi:hypothetical protein
MLRQYSGLYFVIGHQLADSHRRIFEEGLLHPQKNVLTNDDDSHKIAIKALQFAKAGTKLLPVGTLGKEIDRAIEEYEKAGIRDRIQQEIKRLAERFEDELERHQFFYVPGDRAEFYNSGVLFNDRILAKFPKSVPELTAAGSCYAVGQPTACVFHLMRAMEVAVRQLGKRLHVTITPNTTWRKITSDTDAKIKPMPEITDGQKKKKNQWEAARANLHHVGSVWRNNTMHPANSYTLPQAKDVIDAVRVFMPSLCDL